VALSRYHYHYAKAKHAFSVIIFDVHVPGSKTNPWVLPWKSKNRFSFHCFLAKKHLVTTAVSNLNLCARFGIFYPISSKFWVSRHIFVEVPNIKFIEIPSVVNYADTWGVREREAGWKTVGLREMTNLKDTFVI
jgi:hypothetical protein